MILLRGSAANQHNQTAEAAAAATAERNHDVDDETAEVYPIVDNHWCATSSNYTQAVHPKEVFSKVLPIALFKSTLEMGDPIPPFQPYSEGGMLVSFEVRNDPIKGRGLYAKERIKKGTLLWEQTHDYNFDNSASYKAFLRQLPPSLQCDALLWTYPLMGTRKTMVIAMDEGCYFNDGGKNGANADIDTVAIRNIEAGEELLQDYAAFEVGRKVDWFDKIWKNAWGSANLTFSDELFQNSTVQTESKPQERVQLMPKEDRQNTMTFLRQSKHKQLQKANQQRQSKNKQLQKVNQQQQSQQQVIQPNQILPSFEESVASEQQHKLFMMNSIAGMAVFALFAMRIKKRRKSHGK